MTGEASEALHSYLIILNLPKPLRGYRKRNVIKRATVEPAGQLRAEPADASTAATCQGGPLADHMSRQAGSVPSLCRLALAETAIKGPTISCNKILRGLHPEMGNKSIQLSQRTAVPLKVWTTAVWLHVLI